MLEVDIVCRVLAFTYAKNLSRQVHCSTSTLPDGKSAVLLNFSTDGPYPGTMECCHLGTKLTTAEIANFVKS